MTDHGATDPHAAGQPGSDDHTGEGQADDEKNPTGGDKTTEEQLTADNAVEEDTLKALDPDAPSA
ncbi:hypothetical protein [Microbacterium rhizomatis]|uniref:Uncharacterized protein n=1 Tax=Microbacterium rhizomatis TaxID=1631477 RepID=A0A5J5J3C8_9MICO|nr:hypothetical protein [Microbacterium rhizomatis]KAA9108434.1 hypothetical protein F6B43_13755 [Microbacterium rhizomatis]